MYNDKDERTVVVPRNDPINAITMGGIAKQSGMTVAEFRRLL